MATTPEPLVDGRTARRERSRVAIIDAAFALILDGKIPLSPDDIAERADVSVSSVYRNFDGLGDIQHQAVGRFQERFGHLLVDHPDSTAPRADRVDHFVRTRVELYRVAGPMIRLARQRSLDHAAFADSIALQRSRLADQTLECFRPELTGSTPTRASNLVALIDAMTSPESFDVMSGVHARSPRQIAHTWTTSITTLLNAHTTGELT